MKKEMLPTIFLFSLFLFLGFVSSATITVDDSGGANFTSIQDAVDFASDGNLIEVSAGIYSPFIVNKSLEIIGVGEPLIDSTDNDVGILVSSDNVIIDGFEIIGDEDTYAGIIVTPDNENIIIQNNEIHGMEKPSPSQGSTYGILAYSNSGVNSFPVVNLTVKNNEIYGVRMIGISLGGEVYDVLLENNNIHGIVPISTGLSPPNDLFSIGMNIENTENTLIKSNEIDGLVVGINFYGSLASNITVDNNLFIDNEIKLTYLPGADLHHDMSHYAKTEFIVFTPTPIIFIGYFTNIQDAISNTNNGEVVVGDGTYNENIIISNPLVLKAGSNPIIFGNEGTVITINSDDVVIDGMTLTNGGVSGIGIYSSDHSNLIINKNNITKIGNSSNDVVARGIVIVSSSSTVDNVTIKNNNIYDIVSGLRTTSSSTSSSGISIGWSTGTEDITNLLIENNNIFDIQSNTSPWETNTKGQGANGIVINHGAVGGQTIAPKILNNNITNLEGLWSHGIGLEGDTPNAIIRGNTLQHLVDHKDPSDAVAIFFEANPSADTVTLEKNNLLNPLGWGVSMHPELIEDFPTLIVNATNNYWGSCDGPGFIANGMGSNVSINITFAPWIGTGLIVNPESPDGLNNWYVTEPEFTLFNNLEGGNIFYRWDNDVTFSYSSPFKLENIPNQPNVTAGILDLNFWNQFGICNSAKKQTNFFYVDLTAPLVTNLIPQKDSVVNDKRPEITAKLDEKYQSNSGIDKSSIMFKLDGEEKIPTITMQGQNAMLSYIPNFDLETGIHNVTINVSDNAGHNSEFTWNFEVNLPEDFDLMVYSPEDNIITSDRRVPFNITTSKIVERIEYIDMNDYRPRWRYLCRNCDEVGFDRLRYYSFRDGEHNLTIRAMNEFGVSKEVNVSFVIDSRPPRIYTTLPRYRSFSDGSDFYVRIYEENLREVKLIVDGTLVKNLDIGSECSYDGRYWNCYTSQDLSAFEESDVEYWFNVSDPINEISSRKTLIKVDSKAPEVEVVSPINNSNYVRRVPFEIKVNETNFNSVSYIFEYRGREYERRICSRRLDNGFCKRQIGFRPGEQNITIKVDDLAGNKVMIPLNFSVSYF